MSHEIVTNDRLLCTCCKKQAHIKLERHRVNFCTQHFIEHVHRQIDRAIKAHKMFGHSEQICIGVSGGKDSMAAWHALSQLGYLITGIYLNMGFGDFSEKSQEKVERFAQQNNLSVKIFSFQELFGYRFEEIHPYSNKPICGLCGIFKRYYLNRLAQNENCAALVTGHNLDDECAFLLGNVLQWRENYLGKQSPIIPEEQGMIRKTKPLIRLTDAETKLYTTENQIPIVTDMCPHSKGATSHTYKEIMDHMEEQIKGSKSSFYINFVKRALPIFQTYQQNHPEETPYHYCRNCGYKTQIYDKCFVCRFQEQMEQKEK